MFFKCTQYTDQDSETVFMEHSRYWEYSASKASEEIIHTLRNPKFITILTQGHHWYLFGARRIPCPPILISTLISFSHLRLTIAYNAIHTFRKLGAQRSMQLWTRRWPIRYTLHVKTSQTSTVTIAAEENGYGSEGARRMSNPCFTPAYPLSVLRKEAFVVLRIYCRMLAAPIIPLSFSYHTIS